MQSKIVTIKAKNGVNIAGDILRRSRAVYLNGIPKLAEEYFKLGYRLGVHTAFKQMTREGIIFPVITAVRVPFLPSEHGPTKFPRKLVLSADKPGKKKANISKRRRRF